VSLMKLTFVILQYMSVEETKKCVNSIFSHIDCMDYKVIIVDNGSENKAGPMIQQYFMNDDRIDVLILEKNLGFARGNNLGIEYANQKYNPDYMIVMNNDVYLFQNDFYRKVVEEYNHSQFAILGPMIMTAEGKCNVNPGRKDTISEREVLHKIRRYKYHLYLSYFYLHGLYQYANRIYNNFYYYPKIQKRTQKRYKDYLSRAENVQLHGCFLVFSKDFFDKLEGFDNRTFLYMEEDILFTKVKREGLKSVYNPEIIVFHEEDMSTGFGKKKNSIRKKRFVWKNYIQSAYVLLDVLKTEKDDLYICK